MILFLQAFVNLFRRSRDEVGASERQGVSGVSAFGGFLSSFEKSPSLATPTERSKTFDQLSLNVHIVATALRYFAAMISGVRWSVKPPTMDAPPEKPSATTPPKSADQKKADEYARIVGLNLHAMDVPWFKVVRNASQFKWKGHSVQEMIARRMDDVEPGYIGIGTVEHRPQITLERWLIQDRSGIVTGWIQRDPSDGTEHTLDRDKCVYVFDDTLGNSPDGVGLLRHVVELCHQLRRLEQLEIWAYETDLRGVPLAFAPTALLDDMVSKNRLTRADADAKLKGLQDFVTNHLKNPQLGLMLDSSPWTTSDAARTPSAQKMWGLELLKGQGVGLAEINIAVDRKCHEIARTLGVEQFMLGAGGKGSLALSEDKTRNLLELINSVLSEIAACLRQDYVLKIFELNRWDRKYLPTLVPDAAALRSLTTLTKMLTDLSLAGATLDRNDPVINQLRQMANLVDQPYVTDEMKMETKPANDGGTPGKKEVKKPPPGKQEN